MWQTNDNRWKTSTGPSSDELRESKAREPPLNQCIGAVISSLRLDERTWQANFDPLSSSSSSPDHKLGDNFVSLPSKEAGYTESTIVSGDDGMLPSCIA